MPRIEYNQDNCMKCQCADCPVQVKSSCTIAKRPKWDNMRQDMMKMGMDGGTQGQSTMPAHMEEMNMLKPSEMIGLYCSSTIGKSTCNDLDPSQECACPTCMVWMENGLNSRHYCTEGDADQRG